MKKRFISLLFILLIVVLFIPIIPRFVITSSTQSYSFPLKDKDIFSLTYTHSVNKSKVMDFIQIENEQLVIIQSRFYSFGAGIPTSIEDPDATMTITDDYVLYDHLHRSFPEISLFVGTISNHILTINGVEYQLKSLFAEGANVQLRYFKKSIYSILFQKITK